MYIDSKPNEQDLIATATATALEDDWISCEVVSSGNVCSTEDFVMIALLRESERGKT